MLLASQLLSTPPPLLLCRKPKACTPADSAGVRSPVLLMLLELLLRLLEPVVVYFCCYSCHNHVTNAAPGLHLQILAIGSAAAAAAVSGNEPMFLRFWHSAAATSRDRCGGRKNGLSLILPFIFPPVSPSW